MKLAELYFVFFFIKSSTNYRVPMTNGYDRTSQSKTVVNHYADLAIDGSTQTCAMASGFETGEYPWWRVILQNPYLIYKMGIIFRAYETTAPMYKRHLSVYISDDKTVPEQNLCTKRDGSNKDYASTSIALLCDRPILGSVVTVKKYGNTLQYLLLCEVRLFATGMVLVSHNKHAFQHSLYGSDDVSGQLLVDGNNETCSLIYSRDEIPWWRVRLDQEFYIYKVTVTFQKQEQDQHHLMIYVSKDELSALQTICADAGKDIPIFSGTYVEIPCRNPNPLGKYVTISKYKPSKDAWYYMRLCEVTIIANNSNTDEDRLPSEENQRTHSCKNDEVVCDLESLSLCLSKSVQCNKVKDCPNGIDEANCTCEKYEFSCSDGRCIPKQWLCDRVSDCTFNEDEHDCDFPCPLGDYRCMKQRKCIARAKHCDGYNDCGDFADEQGCFDLEYGPSFLYLFLKTFYLGEPGFYICTHNWNKNLANSMCLYLTGVSGDYAVVENYNQFIPTTSKLVLNDTELFENNLPDLKRFKPMDCDKYIQLLCDWSLRSEENRCGVRAYIDKHLGPYLINGNIAQPGAWPWLAQIIVKGKHICGGSIIDENWIFTAANCSENIQISDMVVKVGTNKFLDENAESHKVAFTVNHPNHRGVDNDVGFIRLKEPLNFSYLVRPICLPKTKYSEADFHGFRYCVMAGFGTVNREHGNPIYLMQGKMNPMNHSECAKNKADIGSYPEDVYLQGLNRSKFVCAGSVPTRNGINTCWGDQGSPLVCRDRHDSFHQVAMATTFEYGINQEECTNNLLTKVDFHLEFIDRVLKYQLDQVARTLATPSGIIPFLTISYYSTLPC